MPARSSRLVSPAALAAFVADAQLAVDHKVDFRFVEGRFVRTEPHKSEPRWAVVGVVPGGRRYAHLFTARPAGSGGGGGRSSYGFVDLTNGNVLMSATWHGPDPIPRGNLIDGSDPSAGRAALGVWGVRYIDDEAYDREVLTRLRIRYLNEVPPSGPRRTVWAAVTPDGISQLPALGISEERLDSAGEMFRCDDCGKEYAGPAYYTFDSEACVSGNDIPHVGCSGNVCPACAGPYLEPDAPDDSRRPRI